MGWFWRQCLRCRFFWEVGRMPWMWPSKGISAQESSSQDFSTRWASCLQPPYPYALSASKNETLFSHETVFLPEHCKNEGLRSQAWSGLGSESDLGLIVNALTLQWLAKAACSASRFRGFKKEHIVWKVLFCAQKGEFCLPEYSSRMHALGLSIVIYTGGRWLTFVTVQRCCVSFGEVMYFSW